jgi:hypothetical protein
MHTSPMRWPTKYDCVPITGTVILHTSLGVFLDTQGRRVVVPASISSLRLEDSRQARL